MISWQDAASHFNPENNPHMGPGDSERNGTRSLMLFSMRGKIIETKCPPRKQDGVRFVFTATNQVLLHFCCTVLYSRIEGVFLSFGCWPRILLCTYVDNASIFFIPLRGYLISFKTLKKKNFTYRSYILNAFATL